MRFLLDSAIRFGFDLAVKATFVFLVTGAVLLLMRRSSAATRHRVGTFGLAAALLLPLLSAALPQVTVPILPDVRPAAPRRAAATPAVERARAAAVPASPEILRQLALAVPEKTVLAPEQDTLVPASAPIAPPVPAPARKPKPAPWLELGLALWTAGALAVGARLFVGWSRVRRIGREARPIHDLEWIEERDAAARRLALSRNVELVESAAVPVAMTSGLLRPLLLIGRAARQWAVERRRVVLLHELAHVKRSDWPALIVAELALAAYWFHPLAWWLNRRVRRDAETACDDLVIASGTKPSVYAGHLLGIFRSLGSPAHRRRRRWRSCARTTSRSACGRSSTRAPPTAASLAGRPFSRAVVLAGAAAAVGSISPWAPSAPRGRPATMTASTSSTSCASSSQPVDVDAHDLLARPRSPATRRPAAAEAGSRPGAEAPTREPAPDADGCPRSLRSPRGRARVGPGRPRDLDAFAVAARRGAGRVRPGLEAQELEEAEGRRRTGTAAAWISTTTRTTTARSRPSRRRSPTATARTPRATTSPAATRSSASPTRPSSG